MRRSTQLSLTTCVIACAALLSACDRDEARNEGRNEGPRVGEAVRTTGDAVAQKAGDAAVTAAVKARLAQDADLRAIDINVDTEGGKVVLRGTAPTEAARSKATELAGAVEGVRSVTNDLSVQAR